MRRLLPFVVACVLVVGFGGAVVSADNWVRGKVSAVTSSSVTVMVKGKAMTFNIGKDTDFVAAGLGTASRQAGGLKLAEVIKVGDGVEVHYTSSGGAMQASEIRAGVSGEGMSEATGESVTGKVTAITATSLTVAGAAGDTTFTLDKDTKVIGRGAGTAAQKAKTGGAAGPVITDLLKVGETVVVSYRTMGTSRVASDIRVRR